MLIKNKLTSFLYRYGYNGIENIYDYWISNQDAILEAFNELEHKEDALEEIIREFQYKVRWSSMTGLHLRIEIDKEIVNANGVPLKCQEFSIPYKEKEFYIKTFSEMTLPHEQEVLCDLRGISLMSKVFKNTEISNVDFSYSALDASAFYSVNFKNCRFYKTSFNRCRLDQCSFDSDCKFEHNDFRNAYINSSFRSLILSPLISPASKWDLMHVNKAVKAKYLNFTAVIAKSFINQIKDDRAEKALMKVYERLDT